MKRAIGVFLLAGLFALPAHAASPSPTALAQQFALAGQPAMKLLVKTDGWYRVSFANLRKSGFAVPKKTTNLQLFADGAQVPLRIPRGAIEFYGTALNTATADTHVYWLVNGKTKGLRIGIGKAGLRAGKPAGSFASQVTFEGQVNYIPAVLNGPEPNWFGKSILAGRPATQVLTATNVETSAGGSLVVSIQGYSIMPHVVKVALNGTSLGSVNFDGQKKANSTFPLPAGLVKEGDNTITLNATAGELDFCFLKALTLTYGHTYTADGDVVSLPSRPGQAVTIGGFSTKNIRVIDISKLDKPRELIPTRGGVAGNYTATFRPPLGSNRLYAFANFKAITPDLELNQPSTLNAFAQGADLLIISHQLFIPALQSLIDLRTQQGLQVKTADVKDVFDEFSFGARDPQAIKDFLAWTRNHWQKVPRYILLVGDATYDPRDYLLAPPYKIGQFDFVPTEFIDTAYTEAPCDDCLADFNGDGVPEMAVGRLPVRTGDDAANVVAKIVGYETAPARARTAVLVADKNIDYDFESLSRQLSAIVPPSVSVSTVFRNAGPSDAAVRARLLAALNQGPTIVNYFGHGASELWSNASILKSQDAPSLTNRGSLSLYLMMTCLNGYFVGPVGSSLGEALVTSPAGAVATWSSSGETVPTDQVTAAVQAVRMLLTDPSLTLGDAMVRAKGLIRDLDVRHTWTLLGDPATKLH